MHQLFESHCYHATNWHKIHEIIQTKSWSADESDIEIRSYGKIRFPLLLITGADGKLELKRGDNRLRIDGPGQPPDDINNETRFLPDEEFKTWIDTTPDNPLNRKKQDTKNFFNGEQIRLKDYGIVNNSGDSILDLKLEWTNYYATFLTNLNTQMLLTFRNDGKKVCQIYQAPLDKIDKCRLSNPIAINLSVISSEKNSDKYIFIASRNRTDAWNVMDGIQPAVSRGANKDDLNENGTYDPFVHAHRAIKEEVTGILVADLEVTLFGLARTCKTRFPFLFGDVQVGLPKAALEANNFTNGTPVGIPFTVDGVFNWLRSCYNDQKFAEKGIIIGTTIFSILESCRHRFSQNDWIDLLKKLDEL